MIVYNRSMKPTLYVREISEEERKTFEAGLRSSDAFVMRRCQILMSSDRRESVSIIASQLGCSKEIVRKVINGFNQKGLEILKRGSKRPHRISRAFDEDQAKRLQEMLRHTPRKYEKDSSLWSLELLAEVSYEEGITESKVSHEAVRQALKRLGIKWKRAKHWVTSPDPHYEHKKNDKKN